MYGSVGRSRSAAGAVGAAFAGVVGGRREEGEGDTKSKLRKDRPSDSEQAVCQGGRREGANKRTSDLARSLGRPAGVDVEWRTYIRGAVEREREGDGADRMKERPRSRKEDFASEPDMVN